jgi:tetratricopeptide (TPR) repeat protein
MLVVIMLSGLAGKFSLAGGTDFSFFEKAKRIYYGSVSSLKTDQGNNKNLDSLIRIHCGTVDFKTAEDLTWKIGLDLLKQGKHAYALEIFNDLRAYLESSPDQSVEKQKRISAALNITGAIYEETGLWNEALALYMNSLQISDRIGYEEGKAKIYNNLGKLYFNRNQLSKAEELYKKAIGINKKFNIKTELFNNYNNLAGIYQVSKQPSKSLEYALIALNQLDIDRNFYDLSIIYNNIGRLYQDMGNYPVALSYYQQSSGLQKEKSYSDPLIHSYLAMSSLFQAMKLNDSASFYLVTAQKLAAELGNPFLNIMVLRDAALFQSKMGNNDRAVGLYSTYLRLNDSLEALNSLDRMEQIQSVYKVINEEKNNQILQQQIDLQKLAIQRQQIVLVAALVIFLVLALFLFNVQRLRKREKNNNELITRQTEELHQKEKEMLLQTEHTLQIELDNSHRQLTSYALNLARINEFLAMTTQDLKQILLEMSTKDKSKVELIRKTIYDLHQFSTGNNWEEFRHYFEKVHQSFEKNLLAEFPDLSPNDLKMCALIKLGLSTKDIASITFRELRSVESARNRLRKKLGIPADVNIHNFLSYF